MALSNRLKVTGQKPPKTQMGSGDQKDARLYTMAGAIGKGCVVHTARKGQVYDGYIDF
jgi:hypothetical protein